MAIQFAIKAAQAAKQAADAIKQARQLADTVKEAKKDGVKSAAKSLAKSVAKSVVSSKSTEELLESKRFIKGLLDLRKSLLLLRHVRELRLKKPLVLVDLKLWKLVVVQSVGKGRSLLVRHLAVDLWQVF